MPAYYNGGMNDTNIALEEVTQEIKVQRCLAVVEHQVRNNSSVAAACRATGVPKRSFYRWIGEGVLTDYLAKCKESRTKTIRTMAAEAMPDVMRYMIALATGQETVRGASPIAAAEFVVKAGGLRLSDERERSAQTNIVFLPQMATFHVKEGGLVRDSSGEIEILEGTVEEVDPEE